MKVTLNKIEQDICKMIAKERNDNNISNGSRNRKVGNGDDYQIGLEGYGAEMAFCKIQNLYPDFDCDAPQPFDCYWHEMGWVDVKCTDRIGGMLIVGTWKKEKPTPDYYVLMIGKFPNYEYIGHYDGTMIFNEDNIVNLGYGPVYAVRQGKLKK